MMEVTSLETRKEDLMSYWMSLEKVWQNAGAKSQVKVRFNDWNQHIKYFVITGESTDGKRLVGTLDNGEKMSYPKKSKGWSLYYAEAENMAKAV
jgi:hypothetical protein